MKSAKNIKTRIDPKKRYPYTHVRTVVMRSLLFKKDDYQKMLKMSTVEIIKLLQDSSYKKEVNELAIEHAGSDLMEAALNKSLGESFKKLVRVSPPSLTILIREYAKRKDIDDIKSILRGIFTHTPKEQIIRSITGAGTLSHGYLMELAKKDSIEEVLKQNGLIEFKKFSKALQSLNDTRSLEMIENTFDREYYTNLTYIIKSLPLENILRSFISKEIEIINILTLLRARKASLPQDRIDELMIYGDASMKSPVIRQVKDISDTDALVKALQSTEYKGALDKAFEEAKKKDSWIPIEIELYKYLFNKSLSLTHQKPMSTNAILSFMFAKDMEVRNLRIMMKGKQLGLPEQFIESQLVY